MSNMGTVVELVTPKIQEAFIPLRTRKHLEKSLWKADKVEVMHMLKGFHLGSCFYHVYICQHQITMVCQMNKFVLLLCILDGDS